MIKELVPTEEFPFAAGRLTDTEGIRDAVARLGATRFDLENGAYEPDTGTPRNASPSNTPSPTTNAGSN